MSEEIVIGGIYKHFKGEEKLYRVLHVARDCENPLRNLVIYEQLYESDHPRGTIFARELSNFLGHKEYADGRKIKRFEFVSRE